MSQLPPANVTPVTEKVLGPMVGNVTGGDDAGAVEVVVTKVEVVATDEVDDCWRTPICLV